MMPYFYRHSEGAIIEKPAVVVDASGGPLDYYEQGILGSLVDGLEQHKRELMERNSRK